jgi:hypothetical protein
MTGIRRVSQLGTTGESTYVDGSIQTVDIAANAVTQAKLSTDIPLSGMRNAIINGDMKVAQRGATFSFGTGGGSYYYGADRWRTQDYTWSAGTNPTVSNETTVVPTGFTNAYKWANGATPLTFSSGGNQFVNQTIEGYNASALYGKTCSLSFWVRSSTAGKYSIWFTNGASTRSLLKTYTISSANTWEYKTMTIDMASAVSSGVWEKTTSAGLSMSFSLGQHADRTGSTNLDSWGALSSYHYATSDSVNLATIANSTFYLTGVQLEVGSQATPYEQRPYGIELHLCMRYYQNYPYGQCQELTVAVGYAPANYYYGAQNMRVPFRAAPTITLSSVQWRTPGTSSLSAGSSAYYLAHNDGAYFAFAAASGGYHALSFFISSTQTAEL